MSLIESFSPLKSIILKLSISALVDINEDFLYVGKVISDCDIYDNADTIFIDEINFKEFAREAYEQIEPLKEFWKPADPPQLIHFCYVR